MNKVTSEQITTIKRLLGWTNSWVNKHTWTLRYTNQRTSRITEMTRVEAGKMEAMLTTRNWSMNQMRRKIFALAGQMGWVTNGVANQMRIDNWCLSRSSSKKVLKKQTKDELTTTVTQFEMMVSRELEKLKN